MITSVTTTTSRSTNYGGILQSYALQNVLTKMGVCNRVLDYPKKKTIYEKIDVSSIRSIIISLIVNGCNFIHRKEASARLTKFNAFSDSYILRTEKVYRDADEVNRSLPKVDFFITGSDQVFGVRDDYNRIRMLDFGDNNLLRYSYAASIRDLDWKKPEVEEMRRRLLQFRKISVRERTAQELLSNLCDVDCDVNIDPVFLLSAEEWKSIAEFRKSKEKYILCYPLLGNDYTQYIVDYLKQQTGLKVISVQDTVKRIKADEYIMNAGPLEFIGLFANAEYIVTTSFHGTAFSIIFEKSFYSLTKNYKSSRITDLLSLLGLSERNYTGQERISVDRIDYSPVKRVLDNEIHRGIEYLKSIVDDVERERDNGKS